jgi:2-phospho-L-lactate guanylyltransferase
MRIVLVPMKPLAAAKERLGPALDPAERRRLSLAMLADVIDAARGFDRVWVLQSDSDAAAVAAAAGVEAVDDPAPGAGLNASLDAATSRAVRLGTTGVLVVAADLPAVTSDDLLALCERPGTAIAPDRAGVGTNALWRSPGDAIGVAFGSASFGAHRVLAREAGVGMRVVERPGLAIDVDTPADLAAAWTHGIGGNTRAALEQLDLATRLELAG